MDPPRISVIMPTYNRSGYIRTALDSVISQTYKPLEVIIVDDGSTDNTNQVLKPYKKRIRYIRQDNKGPACARNTGILSSRGDYVALIDSDDYWYRDKLLYQANLISRLGTKAGIVDCFTEVSDDESKILRQLKCIKTGYSFDRLLYSNIINSTSSVVIRKDAFRKCGLFNESLGSVEDREMWLRISESYQIFTATKLLARYRVHDTNFTKDYLFMKANTEKFLEILFSRYDLTEDKRRKIEAYNLSYYLPYYLKAGNIKGLRELAILCIRQNPALIFSIRRKCLAYLALSFLKPSIIGRISELRRIAYG